ncbi:uncharacterized protein KY384_001876 [Bacidia gigantensis]|uniref:uncharacterized protein n=1 Tax=Bacidia gigantensis TaxID=2732470 RepID=UPI001D057C80|nr:uncharacterized protein KY384_001876 [Bacidia gigantensis]KAG8533093.1 hypothetical protein KY384_001876 [Bacidia gigantensis]
MNQTRDMPRQHSYHTSHEYQSGQNPGINIQHATPSSNQYANLSSGSSLPGALQPGRPSASSSITAPSTIPTLPPLQNPNQQKTSSRPNTASHAHSYSRSSPAGLDQPKYAPFVGTPESGRYASTPNHKYTSSQTNQNENLYSPLALADVRNFNEASMTEPQSAHPYTSDGYPTAATNSNYLAPWPVYAFDWCKWPVQNQQLGESAGKMAIGSYVEDGHNFIQILETQVSLEHDTEGQTDPSQYSLNYVKTAEATHSYPVTRILWEPASSKKNSTDLLATSGDHLRLWSLPQQASYNPSNSINRPSSSNQQSVSKLTPLALLSNSKSPEHTAPLTSLDWNTVSPSLIITSSIDTTCTIWDIPTLTAKTQLIAHDKEVFDVRFCANSVDVFVSCGADGSVRMFDLRSLEHSTIIYEPSEKGNDSKTASPSNISPPPNQQSISQSPPLLRLAASPHDAHLLATFSQDSNLIRILDVRQPGQALLELRGHASAINCIEWSPSRRGTLASGGDDSMVLIWDLLNQSTSSSLTNSTSHSQQSSSSADIRGQGPVANWRCDYEVGNLTWAPQSGLTGQTGRDWLGVSGGRGIWGVSM